jgi:acyl-CoA synthetase (AMP-forming)/AMP-acid ligase II
MITASRSDTHFNIAARLVETAQRMPKAPAVIVPKGRDNQGRRQYATYTFEELNCDSDRLASSLVAWGMPRRARLALMVRPGFDFISLVFALFKAGAVQILIDPGMGRRSLLKCLDEAEPEGFIAIPLVHAVRSLLPGRYPRARWNVTVGRRWWWAGPTLQELRNDPERLPEMVAADADDPAAIIFTSGSTGPPKGVLYQHRNFIGQVDQIRDRYGIEPGGVDLACFPLFALFNSAMGVTTVIPEMDATRPAQVDPRNILEAIRDCGVTQSFASPAVWNRVGLYCQQHGMKIAGLKRVFSAGAPVPAHVLERMTNCLDAGSEIHTPYGATEALPVASIAASEVLGETSQRTSQGGGVCVGRNFPGISWKVIDIVDGPINSLVDVPEVSAGTIGELIVRGEVVTREYVGRPELTALAKINDGRDVWHRMGDVGYFDDQQRFWFCGRMSHRVVTPQGTMFTIPCEAIFNNHSAIFRSALVGVGPRGNQRPVIVLEPWPEHFPRNRAQRRQLLEEIRALAKNHSLTESIDDFLLRRSLPVDIRHNAKIFREKLAVWAATRLCAR